MLQTKEQWCVVCLRRVDTNQSGECERCINLSTMDDQRQYSLTQEALVVRWLIYTEGGMATKTAVEDVMLLRHPLLTRYDFHQIMNQVEFYQLDNNLIRYGHLPYTIEDMPEIKQCDIRWWRMVNGRMRLVPTWTPKQQGDDDE